MDNTQENSARSEFIAGIIVLVVGVVFLISAEDIPVGAEDDFGARSLPRAVSIMIIALGALWSVISYRKIQKADGPSEPDPRNRFLYKRVIPLMLLIFIYAMLFDWFGYLVSTFVIMVPVLYIYGNRSVSRLLAIAAASAAVYYLLFIKLMGVFDAGGSLININELLGL